MSENKAFDKVQDVVSKTFQLDRIERLAKQNYLIAVAYAALIGNINYALLLTRQAEGNEAATPSVTSILIGNIQYPITPKGKFSAIAQAFRHFSNKLDDVISTTNIATAMQSVDFIKDISRSALQGSRVSQTVKKD